MKKKNKGGPSPTVGRHGDRVCYYLNGKIVCRRIGEVEFRSILQKEVNMRMSLTSNLFGLLTPFLKSGLKHALPSPAMNVNNYAASLNNPQAIKGVYPDMEFDFPKVILAVGDLPLADNPEVNFVKNNLEFTWSPELKGEGADESDRVMLMAYFPELKKAVFTVTGSERVAGKHTLKLGKLKAGTVIETYMAFISDDRIENSNSVYVGQVIVALNL